MEYVHPESNYLFTHNWVGQLIEGYGIINSREESQEIKLPRGEKRVIVEIGVYEGASSCWWLDNFMDHPDSRLVCVDPFIGAQERRVDPDEHKHLDKLNVVAKGNIAKSKHPGKATVIEDYSWSAYERVKEALGINKEKEERKIDILYIDGEHTTRAVFRDLALYAPLISPGGVVIVDDYNDEAVAKAAYMYLSANTDMFPRNYCTGGQLWTRAAE